jgi:hypothetical protein
MTLEDIMIRDCTKEQLIKNIKDLIEAKLAYEEGLKYFTQRVEEGSIKSHTTYSMYKELLSKYK